MSKQAVREQPADQGDRGELKYKLEFYKPTRSYAGGVAPCEVSLYSARSESPHERKLDKPIIILDGIDFANEHRWDYMYERLSGHGLLARLVAEGHDILFVDPQDGGDYIQRHAFALIDVIEWVNRQKRPGEKNIIIGPSMGGVVARYALAYMEANGIDHDTSLFVSFDAPQEGANVPLGVQWFTSFLGTHKVLDEERKVIGAEALRKVKRGLRKAVNAKRDLDRESAKQLLYYHYSDAKAGQRPLRAQLLKELGELGNYPRACRKIAITNGGSSGEQVIPPGQRLITWTNLAGSRYRADCKVHAAAGSSPNHELGRCDECEFTGVEDSGHFAQPPGSMALDHAPGGYWSFSSMFAGKVTFMGEIKTHVSAESHIPTLSAIGVPLTAAALDSPIPADIQTPFDKVYMPAHSQEHVSITEANVAWLLDEIGLSVGAGLGRGLAVVQHGNELFEAFSVSVSGDLWHVWQRSTGWSDWHNLGQPAALDSGSLVMAKNGDGLYDAFALGRDGHLWHIAMRADPWGWSDWSDLGRPPGDASLGRGLAVVQHGNELFEAFSVSVSGDLWHVWQRSTGWSDWHNLGQPAA